MATSSKKPKSGGVTGFGIVRSEDLAAFGTREMQGYADKVNLDRAIPDLVDGLKPVQRRIMWASHNLPKVFVKTARLVGDVIDRYHPHGDVSVSDSITVMIGSNVPPMIGTGNWGSLIDPAAAMRYTTCTLGHYGRSFFGSQYIVKEVTDFVPNYDDTTVEPVTLPALFPNILLTGAEGIGVGKGTATTFPSFTPESVAEVMIRMLKGEKLKAQDFATSLKWNHRYGGHMLNTKTNRDNWLQMFLTSKARVLFKGKLVVDFADKVIDLDDWPHDLNPISFVEKIRTVKEKGKGFEHVHRIYNSSGATGVRIEADKGINRAQFDSLVAEVEKLTLVPRSFKINATRRLPTIVDGKVSISTTYESMSVPEMLVAWLRIRVETEKKSLEYRIVKQNEAIAYSQLLIFVANNADQIIKIIRRSSQPDRDLMKAFKFTELQASQVLDLKLRSISKLDQTKIKEVLAEQKAHLKQLQSWLAKPRSKVIADTQGVLDAIIKDRTFEAAKDRKMQVS